MTDKTNGEGTPTNVTPIKGEIKRAPGRQWSASTLLDRLLQVLAEETGEDKAAMFATPETTKLNDLTGGAVIELLKDRVIKEAMRGRV